MRRGTHIPVGGFSSPTLAQRNQARLARFRGLGKRHDGGRLVVGGGERQGSRVARDHTFPCLTRSSAGLTSLALPALLDPASRTYATDME